MRYDWCVWCWGAIINSWRDLLIRPLLIAFLDHPHSSLSSTPPSSLGGVVKNWKRRFFVLSSSGLLYYYKDDKVRGGGRERERKGK